MSGALDGVRVLDSTRLAPGPYCSMLLADMGADVVLVEPVSEAIADTAENRRHAAHFALGRNKRSICVDLKRASGLSAFLRLAAQADVILEGFRPGVADRLGIGFRELSPDHPRLVYCSLSGYGQTGPYAKLAGHDLNYVSIGGALGMIGRPDTRPAIAMNFLADYAGGGLMAAFGIVSALYRREKSGQGQYIDVAMSDGILSLATKLAGQYFETGVVPEPGAHRINGGAPYYDVYTCKDGRFLAIGALEHKFFENLCRALDLSLEQEAGPSLAQALADRFLERTRDEWFELLRDADACVTPVYSLDEALKDPHNLAREMVGSIDGIPTVGVVPKLHGTPGSLRRPPPFPGEHAAQILSEAGYSTDEIHALVADRAVAR